MNAGTICTRITHLADPEETVQAAADRMKDQNVGTLLVVDEANRPAGILTDRDLAMRVVAEGLDVCKTQVRQVMSAHPRWVREDTPIEDVVVTMRSLAVRRLPVVDEAGALVGILSIDDVLGLVTEELGNLGRVVGWRHPGTLVSTANREDRKAAVGAVGR